MIVARAYKLNSGGRGRQTLIAIVHVTANHILVGLDTVGIGAVIQRTESLLMQFIAMHI